MTNPEYIAGSEPLEMTEVIRCASTAVEIGRDPDGYTWRFVATWFTIGLGVGAIATLIVDILIR